MSKPSEPRPGPGARRSRHLFAVSGLALVAAAAGLLQLPFVARAGSASGAKGVIAASGMEGIAAASSDRSASRVPPPSAPQNARAPAAYRLRCWQYGRLLFDEGPVALGPEARQGARLTVVDAHGGTLIVMVSGETTCQVRPFAETSNLALPH